MGLARHRFNIFEKGRRVSASAIGARSADERASRFRSWGLASALVDDRLDVGRQIEDGEAGLVGHPDLILPTVLIPEQRMFR